MASDRIVRLPFRRSPRPRVALVLLAGLALTPEVRAEDPPSLALARAVVDRFRGDEHRKKMRVDWPAIEDEPPPEGAEVVLVAGYISYQVSRIAIRGGKVEAGTASAHRSWFYNQDKGESFGARSFEVDRERFAVAWNAMRRILGASDARIEPAPEGALLGGGVHGGTHQSVDWIRVRTGPRGTPVHCADRGSHSFAGDGVRDWDGLRDEAVFRVFGLLIPRDESAIRDAPLSSWAPFAAEEVRGASRAIDMDSVHRDSPLLEVCLRLLALAGDKTAEDDVAALDKRLGALVDPDADDWRLESIRQEAGRAATRLRVRHRWDRDEVIRTLRAPPEGTWADSDQSEWLRRAFREKDPEAWVAFLVEEVTRDDARPIHVARAAAELKDLPAARAAPLLRPLLARANPYVRLEAALALQAVEPGAAAAKTAIAALALDRSIACDQRRDLTNRWCRIRALEPALAWGGLTTKDLRSHLLAEIEEDPAFLQEAKFFLMGKGAGLTSNEWRNAWRLLLDSPRLDRALWAVEYLLESGDFASKTRMLAALKRVETGIAEADEDEAERVRYEVAHLRKGVLALAPPPDDDR